MPCFIMPVGRSVPTVGEVSGGAGVPEVQIYSRAPGINRDLNCFTGSMPSGEAETVHGFATEADAAKWIRQESQAWLYERKAPMAKIAN